MRARLGQPGTGSVQRVRADEQELAAWAEALATADGVTAVDRVLNQRPEYAEAMRAVEAAIWSQDVVDHALLELCRLRIAQLLGLPPTLRPDAEAVGLTDARVDAFSRWPTDPAFTERERLCLGHAEQLLLDATGVDDDSAAAVAGVIGANGYAVLTYACGFFETTSAPRAGARRRRLTWAIV